MAFAVTKLDHVVLRVRDLERAIAFYETVLGCRVERRIDRLGLVQMRAGASMIDLVARPAEEGEDRAPGNMDHFAVRFEPFDAPAIAAHLARHGVKAGEAVTRYGAEGDGLSIYIEDPDGNTVELKGPGL